MKARSIFPGLLIAAAALTGAAFFVSCTHEKVPVSAERTEQDRYANGEYMVRIAGCNDCHTAGYPEAGGDVPVEKWLTGSPLGWRGPWGTTYASNLRLLIASVTEEEWVGMAHNTKWLPPMPWYILRDMKESDLTDIYYFVKALGPAGEPMPRYLPPDQNPEGPYVEFPGGF